MLKRLITIGFSIAIIQSLFSALVPWDSPENEDFKFKEKKKADAANALPPLKEINVPIDAMLIVTGESGVGSGFIAKMKKRDAEEYIFFIVTNIHVIAPNQSVTYETISGEVIKPSSKIFLSTDRDLAMMSIEPREHYLEVSHSFDVDVKIDDRVVVYGNSRGAAVATKVDGAILAIGPDRFEVDAKFVEGNSGSPIIHYPTEKVIGIASYVMLPNEGNSITQDSQFNKPRRFAYRLDSKSNNWQNVTQEQLHEQYELYSKYKSKTTDLGKIIYNLNSRRLVNHVSDPILSKILGDFRKDYAWGRYSIPGNREKFDRLKKDLSSQIKSDTRSTTNDLNITFYVERLREEISAREELESMIERIQAPMQNH
jgi:hypothetical protein